MGNEQTLECMVIGPAGRLLHCRASGVVFPAHDGHVGILPNHIPFFCNLGMGWVTVHREGDPDKTQDMRLLVDGGFALVCKNLVKIVSYDVVSPAETKPEQIEQIIAAIKKKMTSPPHEPQYRHDLKKIAMLGDLLNTGVV